MTAFILAAGATLFTLLVVAPLVLSKPGEEGWGVLWVFIAPLEFYVLVASWQASEAFGAFLLSIIVVCALARPFWLIGKDLAFSARRDDIRFWWNAVAFVGGACVWWSILAGE